MKQRVPRRNFLRNGQEAVHKLKLHSTQANKQKTNPFWHKVAKKAGES